MFKSFSAKVAALSLHKSHRKMTIFVAQKITKLYSTFSNFLLINILSLNYFSGVTQDQTEFPKNEEKTLFLVFGAGGISQPHSRSRMLRPRNLLSRYCTTVSIAKFL